MNVPKFASFRPKPAPEASPAPLRGHEDRSRSKRSARDAKRPDKRHRSTSRERDLLREAPPFSQRHEDVSDLFVVDTEGDVKNLVYGRLHRYSIPAFRRTGAGSVLGLHRNMKIQRDLSDEKGMVLSDSQRFGQLKREKYIFSKMEKPRLLKLRPQKLSEHGSADRDFVPLDLPRMKKRNISGEDPSHSSDSDNDAKHYRSIQGKAKSNQPSDPALQYATDDDSSDFEGAGDTVLVNMKNIELNRKVEETPQNVTAWLALIEHQDTLLRGSTEHRRITNAEMQSTAEIKIHMYEAALGKITSLGDREELLKGLMVEGSKIWEIKLQLQKWENIADENIESLLLWRSYLDFKQSTFATFQYEEVRELYEKRLRLLVDKISTADDTVGQHLSQQLVYILTRYTLFLRECGFTEMAVALWQAVFELHFRAPPMLTNWKLRFQEFWESEVARFGENESVGFGAFCSNPNDNENPTSKTDAAGIPVSQHSMFTSWATVERKMQIAAHDPARTMDETIEDDPFRVILFPDIEAFLFMLSSTHKTARQSLIDGFLIFCRFPPVSPTHNEWSTDPLCAGETLETSRKLIEEGYLATAKDYPITSLRSVLEPPIDNCRPSAETYFSANWITVIPSWKDRYGGKYDGPVSYAWMHTMLKQIVESDFSEELGEYLLAFEWRNNSESIKKVAKGLLKKNSECLRLYNAYAMIEWARGNRDVASTIFTAAIRMGTSATDGKKEDLSILWKSWIWCCLEDGDKAKALKHILCIPEGASNPEIDPGPTNIIRAKQHLNSSRDYLLTSKSIANATIYAELLALLAYLTSTSSDQLQSPAQGNISAYLTTIASFAPSLTTYPSHHEQLLQSSARLFYNHARLGPFRPALLRSTLGDYLTLFPNNTILLSLFTWNESRFRIENRVRTFFTSQHTLSVPQHLVRIRYEIETGTVHSTKAAFEHAISATSAAKANASIWKLYILFTAKNFRRLTKDTWYRAIRACPWVKELYLVGFEILGEDGSVGRDELMGTWKVLGEKGLRVHVDLEDAFDDMSQ